MERNTWMAVELMERWTLGNLRILVLYLCPRNPVHSTISHTLQQTPSCRGSWGLLWKNTFFFAGAFTWTDVTCCLKAISSWNPEFIPRLNVAINAWSYNTPSPMRLELGPSLRYRTRDNTCCSVNLSEWPLKQYHSRLVRYILLTAPQTLQVIRAN